MHVLRVAISVHRLSFAGRRRFDLIWDLGGYRRMRKRGPAHPAKTILRTVVVPAMGTVYVHSLQHSVKLLMAESLLALERYLPGGRPGWRAYRGPAPELQPIAILFRPMSTKTRRIGRRKTALPAGQNALLRPVGVIRSSLKGLEDAPMQGSEGAP